MGLILVRAVKAGSSASSQHLKLCVLGRQELATPGTLEGEVHLASPRLVIFTSELTKDPPHCHGNQG